MLTSNGFMSKYRNASLKLVFSPSACSRESVKGWLKLFGGYPPHKCHAAGKIVRVQRLQVNNARIGVNFRQRNFLILLVAQPHRFRWCLMGIEVGYTGHAWNVYSFKISFSMYQACDSMVAMVSPRTDRVSRSRVGRQIWFFFGGTCLFPAEFQTAIFSACQPNTRDNEYSSEYECCFLSVSAWEEC